MITLDELGSFLNNTLYLNLDSLKIDKNRYNSNLGVIRIPIGISEIFIANGLKSFYASEGYQVYSNEDGLFFAENGENSLVLETIRNCKKTSITVSRNHFFNFTL